MIPKSRVPLCLCLVIASILLSQVLFAGTTGKIAGTIKDKKTGEPLPGANITIEGTTWGAASAQDGYYFIAHVSPGTYTLKVSMIGFKQIVMTNLKVSIDLTTEANFFLEESIIEAAETVVVVAERPLVQKDMTAKMAVIDGETIANRMPITRFNEVLATQAGFVEDGEGELHVRGGRLGEIAYMIDGVLVQNPFDRGFGGELDVDAVSELEVLSGTFNAEYGNAMSAVVNVVTKDGGDQYSGKLQFESAQLNNSPYHQQDWLLTLDNVKALPEAEKLEYLDAVRDSLGNSGYEFVSVLDDPYIENKTILPVLGTISGNLSGPIPLFRNLTFFLSGRFQNENSPLPYGFDLLRVANSKLTYKLTPTMKLNYRLEWSQLYTQAYNHEYKYHRFNDLNGLGSFPIIDERKFQHSFVFTHNPSASTFYTLQGSYLVNRQNSEVPNREVVSDPVTGELISSDYIRRTYFRGVDGSFRLGDVRYWDKTRSSTVNLKFDLTSQVNRNHLVKAGIEWKTHDIFRHRLGMPPREQREFFDQNPVELGVYLQDKLEYDFLIVNVGLRFDYIDPKDKYFSDPANTLMRVTDTSGQTDITTVPQQDVPARHQISPRIGLAHPVTDRTVLHFAYGHFFQFPRFYDIYRNDSIEDILANDALIGNPGLLPEKTVSFEVGIKQQLTDDIAFDLTAYSRDVSNLVSSFFYFTEGRGYTIFTNADFGRIQGIDFSLTKRHSRYVSGRLNYSLSVARGNESDPLEGFNDFREEDAHLRPNRDFFLDFDRRHDLSANFDFIFPKNFGPTVLGFKPFENSGINVLFELASPLPYTPVSREGAEATLNPEKNSARKAWTNSFDLRAFRDFSVADLRWRFFIKIENLFDNINVLRVWSRTGEAWDEGSTSVRPKDRQANPENVGLRRTVRFGLFFDF